MKVELMETKDGSHTLLVPEMNETYHSTHGAITESRYVFIERGLDFLCKDGSRPTQVPINILEVGFGTGLNALLTCLYADEKMRKVNFFTLETYPLDTEISDKLNYHQFIDSTNAEAVLKQLHDIPWNKRYAVSDYFTIEKIKQPLQAYQREQQPFDLIYFDAFAPSKQPDMWEAVHFKQLYEQMAGEAVLLTYCAQGQFRRELRASGFEVEKLAGPPGKAEMTRAFKRTQH